VQRCDKSCAAACHARADVAVVFSGAFLSFVRPLCSMLIAFIAVGLAYWLCGNPECPRIRNTILAGVCAGLGVSGMHYVGQSAVPYACSLSAPVGFSRMPLFSSVSDGGCSFVISPCSLRHGCYDLCGRRALERGYCGCERADRHSCCYGSDDHLLPILQAMGTTILDRNWGCTHHGSCRVSDSTCGCR
jgi:hypothetical protein